MVAENPWCLCSDRRRLIIYCAGRSDQSKPRFVAIRFPSARQGGFTSAVSALPVSKHHDLPQTTANTSSVPASLLFLSFVLPLLFQPLNSISLHPESRS